jgi:mRNA-degrading endonuclease RelE of RelBE toxin-antitoxin system
MVSSASLWRVYRDTGFDKLLLRFPNQDKERILEHLSDTHFDPYQGDIRKLKSGAVWAKRLGEYRVFYEVEQDIRSVNVFHVERRTTQTYKSGRHNQ